MLIGICGGLCSGKKMVARYLVDHHGFKHIHLREDSRDAASSPEEQRDGIVEVSLMPLPTCLAGASVPGTLGPGTDEESARTRPPLLAMPEALVDLVTKHWRRRFVMTDMPDEIVLKHLMRRPFFLLLSVDAPLTVRWRRFQQRDSQAGDSGVSLEEFATRSDAHLYAAEGGVQPLISRATVRLLNTSCSLAHLHGTLDKLDLANADRLRPSWDTYFMALASLAAQRSNCMKRRVGCILVGRERRVISTGYNGTPRGLLNCADGGCPRCNDGNGSGVGLSTCLCIHAEENALLEAGRERIRDGAVLYCDTCPCLTCSIKICQVGISEVVYTQAYSMDGETAAVFRQTGVKLRQFDPVSFGNVLFASRFANGTFLPNVRFYGRWATAIIDSMLQPPNGLIDLGKM